MHVGQQVPGRTFEAYPFAQEICGHMTPSHGAGQTGQQLFLSKTGFTLAPLAVDGQTTGRQGGQTGG